jgi:predicted glycoside hydrolase/deacetylase ChbG (UPF0249 family)
MTAEATPGPLKRLVLCADDFAVHAPASRGIARLAAMGRLSATSVMVLSPRWGQDAALLQELRGRIDVGLHLDWTSDFARQAGHGLSLGLAMLRGVLGGFDIQRARAVIERQLDAFEAQWKAPPDHVDGHQHVQQFAGIREALVRALASRYRGAMPYLRISRAPPGQADLKSRIISGMGARALEMRAIEVQMAGAAALSGIYDFEGDGLGYARCMAGWLHSAPAGSIIMCHPAEGLAAQDAIAAARVREFDYLAGPAFPAALEKAQVALATYPSITRAVKLGEVGRGF